ncbi:hypothetical protein J7K25_01005 [bacterium]|nr:hypothetical protein [bacterium]
MKITIELEFFEYFPPEQLKQFQQCLQDLKEGKHKFGSIELHINDGKIVRVCQIKHFEK